jgi:predicted CoA-binding protein
MNTRQSIEDFLGQKRLAVIGVSRDPKDFTRVLFRELKNRGYDLAPVNPNVTEVDGIPCRSHIQDVTPPVDGALLMISAGVCNQVVRECAQAGIRRIWMYRATGKGAVDPYAVEFCKKSGIEVVVGECPFMFLPQAGLVHRVHGFCKKLVGRYPN